MCALRAIIPTVVDLRVGFTDDDISVGQVVPICLKEIDECRYFTAFFGLQTGRFPQDFSDSGSAARGL